MTSSTHGLYASGFTRDTQVYTRGRKLARVSQSDTVYLSADRGLRLDSLKLGSVVIAYQHAAGNAFPGLVRTARHTLRVDCTRSRGGNPSGSQAPKGWLIIRVQS